MSRAAIEEYERLIEEFRAKSIGSRVGFGSRPALVAVDFSCAFTDPQAPLGADCSPQIESTNRLIEAGRVIDMPVVFSIVRYHAKMRDLGAWLAKIPAASALAAGEPGVALDPRLACDPARDLVIPKKYPSVFFGTDLASILVTHGVDTVLVTGVTTSGCVRATAVDACSHGFRTIVVRDAVGDRAQLPHLASLFDLDMKYADVVGEDEAVAHLSALAGDGTAVVGAKEA